MQFCLITFSISSKERQKVYFNWTWWKESLKSCIFNWKSPFPPFQTGFVTELLLKHLQTYIIKIYLWIQIKFFFFAKSFSINHNLLVVCQLTLLLICCRFKLFTFSSFSLNQIWHYISILVVKELILFKHRGPHPRGDGNKILKIY